jgi:hypothetical protein
MNRFHVLAMGAPLIFALAAPAQQAATSPGVTARSGHAEPGAQDVPTVGEQVRVLTVKLHLTADQQTKIKPIFQQLHDVQLKAVRDQSLTQEERLAIVRPQRLKAHDQVSAILSDDQKKKFEEYLQGPHPEMHGNLTGTASPRPPQD